MYKDNYSWKELQTLLPAKNRIDNTTKQWKRASWKLWLKMKR